jgi:cytochrome oxidase Cu insertion factor (SCO1/SenC/PrrC family)
MKIIWAFSAGAFLCLVTFPSPVYAGRDFEVIDQNGQKLQFYRDVVAGRTVAIDFIFTTCQTVCPTLGITFARVEKLLSGHGNGEIRLISVSVDPVNDTPEQLRGFAAASHGHIGWRPPSDVGWTLLTGDKRMIDELLRALGGYTPDKVLHSTTVLVGRGNGNWVRVSGLGPAEKISKLLLDEARR